MAITKYGRRIFTEIDRPDRELVERFRGIPSSNLNDMMNRMFNMYGDLRCYLDNCTMVGTAFTVHAPEGDNMLLQYAMDLAKPGDVIVVDGSGSMSRSFCGEIMFNYMKTKGIAGLVIDGCIRDAASPLRVPGNSAPARSTFPLPAAVRSSSPATSS